MVLGASEIQKYIKDGVKARFGKDGKQIYPTDLKECRYVFSFIGADGTDKCEYFYPLISNIPDDFEIEGVSVDMSLDKVFQKFHGAVLKKECRNTGEAIEIQPQEENMFVIKPKIVYIGVTQEVVNMPLNLVAKPIPRVTCFSSGLTIDRGLVNPNFYGPLKFGIYNKSQYPILIERGFRIITVTFEHIVGSSNAYVGFHQEGNKISTNGNFAPPR
ncbi:MAG: deoxycytidine triphosphate deaminase [candidate division CPR1 bacterium ADurb.Bin160]|uniref:Deoxycytidine triphosphate deaminase n=1 Tax=candidate division CPR1 bacterium ADurb.Bin160 TaxID=1852826 RepID=A0A1V5ZLY1_9BACT|nr:MAG: deoxycytidine triphosphate deaminase [candidate division CPR1 bacterium ADurb.Bin160]